MLIALCATSCAGAVSIPRLNPARSTRDASPEQELFGQFVGDWDVESVIVQRSGARVANNGEWHFRWILEGTAIQDVFLLYDADARSMPVSYGTTLRTYDPQQNVWRVAYMSGSARSIRTFQARRVGDQIVMNSADPGTHYRWVFSEIRKDTFHWRSEGSSDSGKTWIANQEMTVRRHR